MGPVLIAAVLLAQTADPISGGAGWVGAGLLGAVLAWLMFWHLPAKDKQITDLIAHFDAVVARKDAQIDAQRADFTTTQGVLAATFKAEAAAERMSCEKHYATLAESMNTAFRTLGDQLARQSVEYAEHSRRNQQWIDLLKKEVEDRQRAAAVRERP